MPDENIKRIPIDQLKSEEGAQELVEAPKMGPYLNFAIALMKGAEPEPELEAIRQLPLEKHYVWRVASALKWGFADFDDLSVDADKQTLTPEDLAKVMELLKIRPIQLCILLKRLVGREEVVKMMMEALFIANRQ